MCRVLPVTLAVVAAVLLAEIVPAQGAPAPGPVRARILERLKAADANGDGVISKDEAPERLQQIFDRIDANGDGKIDPEELKRFVGSRIKRAAPNVAEILERLKAADTDGDGKLSLAEVTAGDQQRFAKADANGDGKLDQQELKQVFSAVGKQFPTLAKTISRELKATDTNGDRVLTMEEVTAKRKKDFAQADADGDGKLDAQELKRALAKLLKPAASLPARFLERLKAADANGDGVWTRDEVPERVAPRFDQIDANGDGKLDLEEIKQAFAARPGRSQ